MMPKSMTKAENHAITEELWHNVNEAMDLLYSQDMHLINNWPFDNQETDDHHHVGERAIVFRFAHYLQNILDQDKQFNGYNLDCEYNRNGIECKALPAFPNGVYPDVILHRRGRNDKNLLVIEFKTYWNRDQHNDIKKLKGFTDPKGNYKYILGLAVLIERNRENVCITPVSNGVKHAAIVGSREWA